MGARLNGAKSVNFSSSFSQSRLVMLPRFDVLIQVLLLFNLCLTLILKITLLNKVPASLNDNALENLKHKSKTGVFSCDQKGRLLTRKNVRLVGKPRLQKAFLAVGIPNIARVHGNHSTSYLVTTLKSLLVNLEQSYIQDVIFVVYLADEAKHEREVLRQQLEIYFKKKIKRGLIHIIEAPFSFYPQLKGLPSTLGDGERRMYWRSKQTMDVVYIMRYCENLASYYLHLEDDIKVTTKGYVGAIKRFIDRHSMERWPALYLSVDGFIGRLFRSEDLDSICRFMKLFYNEYPPDLLLKGYVEFILRCKDCANRFGHKPVLFEHVGRQSSSLGT